ncbi:MAG: NUDIX domain-containing protein [Cyanobacteria bacterium P01_G01_bin.39]
MNNLPEKSLTSIAVAIIYQDGKYLMQLRDDVPHIIHPGVWGFFGGHLEPGEEPEAGLKRELIEEINYHVEQVTLFRCERLAHYLRYLYYCPLTVSLAELELREGWDFKLLTPAEIRQGTAYSSKALAHKPLGETHRQVMLDFINSNVDTSTVIS